MAALVKAEDVGDRDKRDRVEEAGAAGNLRQHLCSPPSSRSVGEPWGACGDEEPGLAGLCAPAPNPLCSSAGGRLTGSPAAACPRSCLVAPAASGVLGWRGGKQSKAEPVALEERKGVKPEPRAGIHGQEGGQRPARLPRSARPFPAWGGRRGPSCSPPACPGPRRGVKSRVVPGIMILL